MFVISGGLGTGDWGLGKGKKLGLFIPFSHHFYLVNVLIYQATAISENSLLSVNCISNESHTIIFDLVSGGIASQICRILQLVFQGRENKAEDSDKFGNNLCNNA
ncbi:MAG TPA: hypothetical protein V6D25_19755 [Leptolyngbyaceae cyanobacterium]